MGSVAADEIKCQTSSGYVDAALWRQKAFSIIFIAFGEREQCCCPINQHADAECFWAWKRAHLHKMNWNHKQYKTLRSTKSATLCPITLPKSNYTQ